MGTTIRGWWWGDRNSCSQNRDGSGRFMDTRSMRRQRIAHHNRMGVVRRLERTALGRVSSTVFKIALFLAIAVLAIKVILPAVRPAFIWMTSYSEIITVPATRNGPGAEKDGEEQELKLVVLMGYDGIPAILDPEFAPVQAAQRWMESDEQVLGLSINGEHRAYPVKTLGRHEIVNDVVGGTRSRPVKWCKSASSC